MNNLVLNVLRTSTPDHAVNAQVVEYMPTVTGSLSYTAGVIVGVWIEAMLEELDGNGVIGGIVQKSTVEHID